LKTLSYIAYNLYIRLKLPYRINGVKAIALVTIAFSTQTGRATVKPRSVGRT